MLYSVGVIVSLSIPYVPGIPYFRNTSTPLSYAGTTLPKYEHLHRSILLPDISENMTVLYIKYLMALIQIVNKCDQLGRNKLFQIYIYVVLKMASFHFKMKLKIFLDKIQ